MNHISFSQTQQKISPFKEMLFELVHMEYFIFIKIKMTHSLSTHKNINQSFGVLRYFDHRLKRLSLCICKLRKIGDKINVPSFEIVLINANQISFKYEMKRDKFIITYIKYINHINLFLLLSLYLYSHF